jgi:hypothetical protein
MNNMNFGEAITALKNGHRVAREGWNGKGMWLALEPGVEAAPNTTPQLLSRRPYIQMKDATDQLVPWLASQTDMLAEDWGVVG